MRFKHDARWFFGLEDPNDRRKSTSRRHALEGSNLSTVERVVREAVQNSVDATLENQKTDILIQNRTLAGVEVNALRELLRLGDDVSPATRLAKLGLRSGNAIEQMCAGGEKPSSITATIIEDYNTCGLGYDARDSKNRFEELCLSFGQDATSAVGGRGGSYGFGKEVYEEASDCNMFLVYSVFEPCEQTEESHALLFGCATFDGHEWDGFKYTGRSLFGRMLKDNFERDLCRPLVDDRAHEVARKLGFDPRSSDDLGTSIMILGTQMHMEEVKLAIETYWWPRILSNQLSVELQNVNDELSHPDPLVRSDLEPYARCYSLIQENVPAEQDERVARFRAIYGAKPGLLAMKAVETDDYDESEDARDDTDLTNTVALIRSGPRMVVEYIDPGGGGAGSFVGVFVSDPESEEALHLSEPPSHDSWNPNSLRLRDAYPDDPEKLEMAGKLVESIMRRIKNEARRFRRDLNPAPVPTPTTGTRALERLLAHVMSGRGRGGPPRPPTGRDPFEIRIREGRRDSRRDSRVTARIEVGLKAAAPMDMATAIVSLTPTVVLDDNLRREQSERIGLSWVKVGGRRAKVENDYDVRVEISKTADVVVEVHTEKFDRDLYASLDVAVHIPDHTRNPGLHVETAVEDGGSE